MKIIAVTGDIEIYLTEQYLRELLEMAFSGTPVDEIIDIAKSRVYRKIISKDRKNDR